MRDVALRGLKMWGVGIVGSGVLHGAIGVSEQKERGRQPTLKTFLRDYNFGCIRAAVLPPVVVANAIYKAIEKMSGRDR